MKVLIVEDNTDIVDFISIALSVGFTNCEVITTHLGNESIELVEKEKPDIILLDVELPDLIGYEVLKRIRNFSQVPVIIITIRHSESDIVKGLSMGADEYLRKPFGQMELLARIRLVLRRTKVDINDTLCNKGLSLDLSHRALFHGPDSVRLTPTECLITEAFLKNSNGTQTFDELAEAIWGTDYSGADDTIRSYIRRLRRKIATISHGDIAIISKPGIGFILDIKQ